MRTTSWPDCSDELHEVEMAEQVSSDEFAVFVYERGHGRLGGFIELSIRHRVDGTTAIQNERSIRAHGALGFRETFRLVHFVKSLK